MVEITRALTVGNSVIQGASSDKKRTSITFQNTHATAKVYVGSNPAISATNGFRIPAGGTVTFAPWIGDDPTINFYLISDTASTTVIAVDGYGEEQLQRIFGGKS